MKKQVNKHTYKRLKKHQEAGGGKSLTRPNEAYSLKEILQRAQMGIAPEIYKRAIYVDSQHFDDIDLESVKNMDIAELQELSKEIKLRVKQINEQIEVDHNKDETVVQTVDNPVTDVDESKDS